MKITIESTNRVITADGVPCRVWEGETASGVKVQCLIPRIAARADQDLSQFEKELQEKHPPLSGDSCFPLRMIL